MLLGKNWVEISQVEKLETLCAVPPNNSQLLPTGKFTIQLKIQHVDLPFDKQFQYRYQLWGQEQPIYFQNMKSQLKTTVSFFNVCLYLHDANILHINIISMIPFNQKTLNRTKSQKGLKKGLNDTQRQKKIVGNVYVPLRRFFVNGLLSNFNQVFFIVDSNKKKIGQIVVGITIQMLQEEGKKYKAYLLRQGKVKDVSSSGQSRNQEQKPKKKVTISNHHKKSVSIAGEIQFQGQQQQQSDNQDKNLMEKKYSKKSYFTHEELDKDINFQFQDEESIKQQIKRNQRTMKQIQSKSKGKIATQNKIGHQNVSKNQNTTKQEHTELSLIRQKWGSNHPTIQLMKLRLDQVKYIQDESPQGQFKTKEQINMMPEIRIYLKKLIPIVGKINTNQFTIHYSKKSKIISTQLNLESVKQEKDNKFINHLLVLTNPNIDDILTFQTKQTLSQFKLSDIVNRNSVDLRKKDTKRRAVQMKFQILSNSVLNHENDQIHSKEVKNPQYQLKNARNSPKPSPKNINRNVNAAQKQNGFRQPNTQVQLQKLSLLEKQINKSQLFNKGQIDSNQYLKKLLDIFTRLYESEDQKFYELIMKILSLQAKVASDTEHKRKIQFEYQRQKYISELQSQLYAQQNNKNGISLQKVLIRCFNNNFKYFFDSFESFKQINHKYQIITYKLTKKLSSPQQNILIIVSKILEHIKKYKKSQVNFGLISSTVIFQQFNNCLTKNLQKQQKSQQQKQNQQNSLENVKYFVEGFLKLFERYNSQLIKITELAEFIKQFHNYQKKRGVFSQALIPSINFGNLMVLFNEIHKNQAENSLQISTKEYYQKLTNNEFFRIFVTNVDKQQFTQKIIQSQTKMSLYDIIFNDVLTLSEAQSSLNFYEENNFSQRIQTQPHNNDRIRTQSLRHNTEGEQIRLRTQQFANQQKRRLKTQDQNVIQLMNNNKKHKQIKQEKEQQIYIQLTKRQVLFNNSKEKQHSEYQIESKKQDDINLHQQSLSMICEQPDTKYINLKITQVNKQTYFQKIVKVFYAQDQQSKLKTIQLKVGQSIIVPNCHQKMFQIYILFGTSLQMQILEDKVLVSIRNICGKQTYSIDNNDGKIMSMVQVQIQTADEEQYSAQQQSQSHQQKEFIKKSQQIIFLNIIDLLSLNLLQNRCHYRVIVQQQDEIVIRQVEIPENNKNLTSRRVQLNIGKIPLWNFNSRKSSSVLIKILKINKFQDNKTYKSPLKTQKQLTILDGSQICEFNFIHKLNNNHYGVERAGKWLVNDKFRLSVQIINTIFVKQQQQNIQDKKTQVWNNKINNLLNVFQCKNQAKIKSILLDQQQKTKDIQSVDSFQFILNVIKEKMNFRSTELEILTLVLFPQEDTDVKTKNLKLLELFTDKAQVYPNKQLQKWNLNNLYEQFQIFDFQSFGLVKKINGIVFKKAVPALAVQLDDYVIFPQKNSKIQDLKLKKMYQKNTYIQLIDYFKILWKLRSICTDDYFYGKISQIQITNEEKQVNIQKPRFQTIYSKIQIQSFTGVCLNGHPCSITFCLEEPYQTLNQSSHRCYAQVFQQCTRKSGYSKQSIFKIGIYSKQYHQTFSRGLYNLRKIQQLNVMIKSSLQIGTKYIQTENLKILSGSINIQIQILQKKQYQQSSTDNLKNIVKMSPGKQVITNKKMLGTLEKQFFQYEDVEDSYKGNKKQTAVAQIQKSFQNTKKQWIKAATTQKNKNLLNLTQDLKKEELDQKFNIANDSSEQQYD